MSQCMVQGMARLGWLASTAAQPTWMIHGRLPPSLPSSSGDVDADDENLETFGSVSKDELYEDGLGSLKEITDPTQRDRSTKSQSEASESESTNL